MNPASVEDFERAVVVQLQARLQNSLNAISARYLVQDQQDGLAEEDGTSWVAEKMVVPERTSGPPNGTGDYYPGGIDVQTAWPSIEVAVSDMHIENFSLGQEDADALTTLIVVIWLKDGRFPVLNRLIKRYTSAVFDVLKTPGVLPSPIQEARVGWRTNPEQKDDNDRLQSGALLVLTLDDRVLRA